MQTRGLVRKASPVAAVIGKPLRIGAGFFVGLGLGRAVILQDWTDVLLGLGVVCALFMSITMHFEPSEDDL